MAAKGSSASGANRGHNHLRRFFFTIALMTSGVSTASAQSPTCDIATIMSTFQGAGYIPLAVQGEPCSLYFINPNSQQAGTAQNAASTLGANLVVMNDAAENAAVTAALNASPYSGSTIWIGYQRTGTGASTFFASDGTSGPFIPDNNDPNLYQNWAAGEPNDNGYGETTWYGSCDWQCQNGEQCVQIYTNGQWNDQPCNDNSISVIEVNLCPELTVAASTNNVCAGVPVILTASTLLGSAPYQYAWSTNETGTSITVTESQTTSIDVGVVDRYSCSAQQSVTVDVLPTPEATFTVSSPVCMNDPATVTYTGSATSGATYDWSFDGGTVASGSGQGPYQVSWATSGTKNITLQVTENGCASPVETGTLNVSPAPVADFTSSLECEGIATVFTNTSSVSGGTIASQAWDFGGGSTSTASGPSYIFASAGTYPVTLAVLSADGCPAQVTHQVTVNPGPSASFSATDITCFGACDGQADVTVQGGASPYSIAWDNAATGTPVTGLCPGTLTGTVTDANGCEIIGQVSVSEPDELTVSVAVTETSCPLLNDGTATETVSGGTPPYSVDWAGSDPNALPAGVYTVTATDANGCSASAQATIVDGAGLSLSLSVTDNICYGGTDGAVTITVSDGIPAYAIVWTDAFGNVLQTDPASQGVESLTGLASGTYSVAVQDNIGCMDAMGITVSQPAQDLVMNIVPQDLSCYQSADGQLAVDQNGLAPFDFVLTDNSGNAVQSGQGQSPNTFQGLDAGVYFVNVTDANGCSTADVAEVFQPDALQMESTVGPVLCFDGSQGFVDITQISGGTTPYQPIAWDDPNTQSGNTATGLTAGSYTATLTDANGCELQETFTLTEPPEMTLSSDYLTDTCGQGKGAAIIGAELGTPPYSYMWKPDSIDLAVHYGLIEGSYEVVVTDANGCKDSVFVAVSDDLPYPAAAFDYRIEGETLLDRQVQFLNHSVATSQWTWNFGNGESSNDRDPRYHYGRAGDYLVQLLASNGFCVDTAYQYVNIDPMMLVYVPNAFTPGINGTNDYFFPQGEGIELESYDMFIYDRWGKLVWQTGNFNKKWDGTNMFSLKPVPVGVYVYLIKFREYADLDRHVYKGIVNVIRD